MAVVLAGVQALVVVLGFDLGRWAPAQTVHQPAGVVLMRVILSREWGQDASVSSRSRMPSKIF